MIDEKVTVESEGEKEREDSCFCESPFIQNMNDSYLAFFSLTTLKH